MLGRFIWITWAVKGCYKKGKEGLNSPFEMLTFSWIMNEHTVYSDIQIAQLISPKKYKKEGEGGGQKISWELGSGERMRIGRKKEENFPLNVILNMLILKNSLQSMF